MDKNILARTFPVLIVAAVLLAYCNIFQAPFVLDDLPSIAGNPTIRSWDTALTPPVTSSTHGRPVLNLSFALNYIISAGRVWSYHLVNLLIHLANALLLYTIVRRTVAGRATPTDPGAAAEASAPATYIAGSVALLWAVHPLVTSAVTYTVQRAESLAGLFLLVTLYSFMRFVSDDGRHRTFFGVLSIASCFLGMATKEVMVVAPVMVCLYDRTFVAGSFAAALRRRRYYLSLVACWVPLAILVLNTHGRGGTAGFGAGVSAWRYAVTQAPAIAHYIRLVFWPYPLIFYYGTYIVSAPLRVIPQALLVFVLLAGTLWALRRRPKLGFLGAAFFLLLAPSSSVVPVITETVAEHRMYLALVPVIVLFVVGLYSRFPRAAPGVSLVLAGGLAVLTFSRNASYESALRLWTDTVAADPRNPWAHNNRGVELDALPGRMTEAVAEYKTAIALRPEHAEAHYNLANDLRQIPGQRDEVIAQYEAALQARPDFPKAHNNLGTALLGVPGRLGEAIAQYREAIRLYPGYAEAHFNLGNAWSLAAGHERDAVAEYKAALELRPDYAEAHNNLGKVYTTNPSGAAAAIEEFRAALIADPADAEAHYNLGTVLSTFPEHRDEAVAQFQEAIRHRPTYAEARNNLANLWAAQPERWDDAVAQYRLAIAEQPTFAEEHYNLAATLLKRPGHESEARAELHAYLRLDPQNPQARQLLDSLDAK